MKKNRIDEINAALEKYFQNHPRTGIIRAKNVLPEFIKAGIYKKNHRDGLPLRNDLRKLDEMRALKKIPYLNAVRKETNTYWYFINPEFDLTNRNNGNVDFFTKDDLTLLSEWAGKKYVSGSEHKEVGEVLKRGPYIKTDYWQDRVATKTGLKSEFSQNWLNRGTHFHKYSWARLYDSDARIKDIYFTIGISGEGEPFLHIKLDYQFEKPNPFSEEQQKLLKNLLRPNGEAKYEIKIPLEKLSEKNWNVLIKETTNFIKSHKEKYYEILGIIEGNRKHYFTRVCWNDRGWKEPSGRAAKGKGLDTFEGITGIGHEEWLFSERLQKDGYQYGFLQANNLKKKPPVFDVDLYTYKNTKEEKQIFYVATINELEVLSKDQQNQLKLETEFISNFIKDNTTPDDRRRLNKKFPNYYKDPNINVRFRNEKVTFPEQGIIIPIEFDIGKNRRYQLHEGSILDSLYDKKLVEDEYDKSEINLENYGKERGDSKASSVNRSAGSYQNRKIHIQLSEKLEKHLNKIKSVDDSVISERVLGRKAVDMVWETPREYIFYEIKTYSKVSDCIRNALGQLLEYAFFRRSEVDKDYKLIIMSQHKASKSVIDYMTLLKANYDLPIYYQQYDLQSDELSVLC